MQHFILGRCGRKNHVDMALFLNDLRDHLFCVCCGAGTHFLAGGVFFDIKLILFPLFHHRNPSCFLFHFHFNKKTRRKIAIF